MSIKDYFTKNTNKKEYIENITSKSWLKVNERSYKITKDQFEELWNLHPEHHHKVIIGGKEIPIPRYQDLYSDDDVSYNFTGSKIVAKPINNNIIKDLLKIIQKREDKIHYNAVFVNWYDGGDHYIGSHSDDTRDLVDGSSIYSFSFGVSRTFRINGKGKLIYKKDLLLEDGMMIVMGGDFQKELKHSVLKKKGCKGRRINFTIRAFK